MSAVPPPFGPFVPHHLLGTGGMAEVWAATHAPTGTPVAIKRLQAHLQGRARALFQLEVEAMASLQHPRILLVWDHGTDEEGRAWVALERAEASMEDRPPRDWKRTLAATIALLEALAHAHSRRIVHRDVKPGNLLLVDAPDPYRLADFGLAHVIGATRSYHAGTPLYMAPEQFDGRHRDFGPWTDLYAVGCVLWQWVSGAPPYDGSVEALRAAHRTGRPPRLAPRFDVPNDLEALLRELLAADPARRPASAASALADLLSCSSAAPRDRTVPTRLPVPATWRRPPSAPPPLLTSAGVGLFGIRRAPLVGRSTERDLLWSALSRVAMRAIPEIVVVGGPEGAGASALGRWLCERVSELDVATALPVMGSLADLLRDRWGCGGLDDDQTLARLRGLEVAEPERVARAITTGAGALAVASEQVAELASAGAVVVWVDDPDLSGERLALARDLLSRSEHPILVVATGRVEQLGALEAGDAGVGIELGPLSETEVLLLLYDVLGIERASANRLMEVVGRLPGPLLEAVRRSVAAGRVRATPLGHELDLVPADEEPLPLPLVVLALLGEHGVTEERWEEVCRRGGDAETWREVLDHARRLGSVQVDGVSLVVHPSARRRAAAGAEDVLRRAHDLIADTPGLRDHERVWHLAEAGRIDEAMVVLRELATHWRGGGEARVLDALRRVAAARPLPDDHADRRVLQGLEVRIRIHFGDLRDLHAQVEALVSSCERFGEPTPPHVAMCCPRLGDSALARRVLATLAPPTDTTSLRARGLLCQLVDDLDEARACYDELLAAAMSEGMWSLAASTLNDLAHLDQLVGRSEDAADRWRRSLSICRERGVGEPLIVEYNLVAATAPDDVATLLDLAARAERVRQPRLVAMALSSVLLSAARRGSGPLIDQHAAAAMRAAAVAGLVAPSRATALVEASHESEVLNAEQRRALGRVARVLAGRSTSR
ncbi:MAG: protein kinase [Alphaproteobacteria bacterium]|nr:protein kinase [Alphaproteobacteria bacterium]